MSVNIGWDDMSVQDIIDQLMTIEDKNKLIKFTTNGKSHYDLDEIAEDYVESNVVIVFLK